MSLSSFKVFSSDTYLILKCRGGLPNLGPTGPDGPGLGSDKMF